MENFYKKVIFDITQLIINKSYKRAIVLGQFLLSRGFRTNELIVTISFAHNVLYGPKSAIEYLQQYSQIQKSKQQGSEKQKAKSPLMQLALAQYKIENQKRQQALQNMEQLINITEEFQQNNEQNCLYSIIKQLHNNYQSENINHEKKEHQQFQNSNMQQNEIQLLSKQINHVTQTYFQQRDQLIKQKTIQPSQIALKYGHFYVQYNEIKRKILTLVTQLIKKDTIILANKKIKKKQNKLLKDNSNNKQTKFIINKAIEKKIEQQIYFDKNDQTFTIKIENFVQKKGQQKQQFILQPNQMQQLQSLLTHVNQFISFFKNKLKDYGASRVRQFQFQYQQTQEQNKP